MTAHDKTREDVLKALSTDEKTGLSAERAKELLTKHGENKLSEKSKKTMLQRFLDQFKDAMIIILIIAAIISFVIVCVEQNWGELFEPALIVLIVILISVHGLSVIGIAAEDVKRLSNTYISHDKIPILYWVFYFGEALNLHPLRKLWIYSFGAVVYPSH